MKKPKKGKARQNRRRRERSGRRSKVTEDRKIRMMRLGYDGQEHGTHDDCPYCVALRELGLDGNGTITLDQYAAFRARAKQLIEERGMNGGVWMTGETLRRRLTWLATQLDDDIEPSDRDEAWNDDLSPFTDEASALDMRHETLN